MTSLQERAEQAQSGDWPTADIRTQVTPPDPADDYEPREGDPDMVPVHIAWLRVRRDIRAIGKRERYDAAGTKFNFRGVDTVVKAFGPVTLNHGVNVFSVRVDSDHRDTTSSKGNKMRECTVTVTWHIYGPKGDYLVAQSCGEALDSADKGTAKAQSVALRVLLLTGGLTPTGDPDPDSVHLDRGEAPIRPLPSYVTEIVDPNTSDGRLRQIWDELKQQNRLGALVENETGAEEQIGEVMKRVVQDRKIEAQRTPGGES